MRHQRLRAFVLFFIAIFLLSSMTSVARAVSFDSLIESVTDPFNKFSDDAEKTVASATPRFPTLESIKNIDVKSLEPGAVFANLKTWLANKTGSVWGSVKWIGALLADILSYTANFLRRAVELLP